MELKEGYKQTEVGVIPEDWEVLSLGELFSIAVGGDLRKEQFCPRQTTQHKFPIYANSLSNNGLYGFCSTFDFSGESITVTARGDIGHAETRNNHFCAIGRLLVLSPKDNHSCKFFSDFINCFVQFPNENTGVPQLTAPQLAKHLVIVPKYAEQKAIATVLSDVDALLSSLDALIAKKRDIKTAAMQELLTGKKRLQGFTNAWRTLPFEQCALQIREFASPQSTDGSCIELENIAQNSGNLVGKLPSLSTASSIKLNFQSNDVLFGRLRVYLHKFYYAKFSGVCSPEIWVLRALEKNTIPSYLYQIIQTDSFITAASVSYGTHMPRADWNVVKKFLVHLPTSLKEQAAIAAVLSDMDAEIAALETRRAKVQSLKQGMMQELLTGRTRLLPEGEQHG